MASQYIVSSSDTLDFGDVNKYDDVFDTQIEAQAEASTRASEGYGNYSYYVHELTSRPVFRATPVRTVATEVM